jgi:hypothetical protein
LIFEVKFNQITFAVNDLEKQGPVVGVPRPVEATPVRQPQATRIGAASWATSKVASRTIDGPGQGSVAGTGGQGRAARHNGR